MGAPLLLFSPPLSLLSPRPSGRFTSAAAAWLPWRRGRRGDGAAEGGAAWACTPRARGRLGGAGTPGGGLGTGSCGGCPRGGGWSSLSPLLRPPPRHSHPRTSAAGPRPGLTPLPLAPLVSPPQNAALLPQREKGSGAIWEFARLLPRQAAGRWRQPGLSRPLSPRTSYCLCRGH